MTKFMGKHQLVERLAYQVGSKERAKEILIERGHMRTDGSLTDAGRQRDNMTAAERAIDRARRDGKKKHPISHYQYNPITNKATLKRRK